MSPQPLSALLHRLCTRLGRGPRLGLEGVRAALGSLGDPHLGLPAVHVAGTNGKGSVCAMVEAVARAAGLRTGLYTSPHLCRFHERIRLDGEPIADEPFAEALALALDPRLPELTFFETLTVAGFWAMRRAGVDLAVVEVGLGGRLDATNALASPLATAIVTIAQDHQEFLGHELVGIGLEKAGIVKARSPLVLGALPREVTDAIVERAVGCEAGPIWALRDERDGAPALPKGLRPQDDVLAIQQAADDTLVLRGPSGRRARLCPRLAGPHQVRNAAVATGLIWQLTSRWPALPDHLDEGLAEVRWPGRLETLQHDGIEVVLDCAHNPEGAEALGHALGSRLDPARTTLLFGALDDKAWRTMLAVVAPLAQRRVYTEPLRPIGARRSAPLAELAAAWPGQSAAVPEQALALALAATARGQSLLVTGSIFLVGAVRAALLGLQRDEALPA